jgi:hypothetical protein
MPGMPQARPMLPQQGGMQPSMPGADPGLGRFFGPAAGQQLGAGQQLPSMPSSEDIERSFLMAGRR